MVKMSLDGMYMVNISEDGMFMVKMSLDGMDMVNISEDGMFMA